jgi:hypothetical protein
MFGAKSTAVASMSGLLCSSALSARPEVEQPPTWWDRRVERAGAEVIHRLLAGVGGTALVELCHRLRVIHHHRFGYSFAAQRVAPLPRSNQRYSPNRSKGAHPESLAPCESAGECLPIRPFLCVD